MMAHLSKAFSFHKDISLFPKIHMMKINQSSAALKLSLS